MNNFYPEDVQNIARLRNLKKIGGRRNVGPSYPQIEEDVPPDLTQTANIAPMLPPPPVANEFSAGDDVRANAIINPQDERYFLGRLGRDLNAAIDTQRTYRSNQRNDLQGGMEADALVPQEMAQPVASPEQDMGFFEKLGKGLYGTYNQPEKAPVAQPMEEQPIPAPVPEVAVEPIEPVNQQVQNEPEPQQELGTYATPGAAQQVYQEPSVRDAVDQMFGIEITPEVAAEISNYEKAIEAYGKNIDEYSNRLTEHQREIRRRLENKDLNGNDKLLMALALLAPALVGGAIGGPEAALAGVGGGAKAIADILNRREERALADEGLLSEVGLEKAKAAKEFATLPQQAAAQKEKIINALPNKKLRDAFLQDGKILNGKLVLDTGNEVFPLKASRVKSLQDIKNFKEKDLPKLENQFVGAEDGMRILNQLEDLIDYAKKARSSSKGLQSLVPFYETTARGVKAFIPATRDTFIDENGNEIKIDQLAETYRRMAADKFRQAEGGGKAYQAQEKHFEQILRNPFSKESFLEGGSSLDLAQKQIRAVEDELRALAVKAAESKGVDTDILMERLKTRERPEENKKSRANQAAEQVIRGA